MTQSPASGGSGGGSLASMVVNTEASTEAMRVDASGNVGIGTASPNNQLVVAAQASFGGNTSNTGTEPIEVQGPGAGVSFHDRTGGSTGRWVIYSDRTAGAGTETLRVWSNGDKVDVTQDGKVGIGTQTPRNPVGIRATGISQELLSFEDPSGETKWHINQDFNNNSGLNFVESGVADGRLFIQAGGNVGVNTTAPSHQLHVNGNTGIRQNRKYMSGGDGGDGGSSLTYNAHRNASNNEWIFPDPTHPSVTLEMDSAYGPSRFEVWTTTNSATKSYVKRFAIDGDTGLVTIQGNLQVNGAKHFVQEHSSDPTRQIVYVSLEGDEAGTYTRGTWKLEEGKAVIDLPEHFGMVTSEDGLSIQLTPRGEWLQLYVVRLTTRQVVIREAQGKSGQFDYFIQGVRKGFEHHEVVQEKK